ncbi:NADPH dehydrogenase [Schizosaccharomyces japonicus yFS275]|uniref:NADPH dehydrogenase n=1 Tax=Schizosaccharomyces japonicus (strain yFS275 / FY16936) TaxID=402676 RepID=B6K8D7_SCHJY|nr:NADPH dehydrogenase [Schizosaccharomyces japonicus yFS275]EEB09791.1 NADPH dehydrogenase [Schizosaccharomyces japonicus yFS275]
MTKNISAGAAESTPKTVAFTPLTLRGVTFHNRIWVPPMCMFCAVDGMADDFHFVHYGSLAIRGPGCIVMEATAVSPEGRISPGCLGLWKDEQISPMKRIVDFAHSYGQKIGIQLAHAGRKASCTRGVCNHLVDESEGGWPNNVYGPTDVPFQEGYAKPKAASKADLKRIHDDFVSATKRAVTAGFDFVEIHGAHGYFLSSMSSPASNTRTDEYGGSFENRVKYPLEVTNSIRKIIPEDMPLFYRINGTDWLEPGKGWEVTDLVKMAKLLKDAGVDFLNVSTGGADSAQQIPVKPFFQVPFAEAVKKAVPGLAVGTVGLFCDGKSIESVLKEERADVVFVGRAHLRNPAAVSAFATELDEPIVLAPQYIRSVRRRH